MEAKASTNTLQSLFTFHCIKMNDTTCTDLDGDADGAEQEVGQGQAGQEDVGGRLHLAVAQDGHQDQEVAHQAQQQRQAGKR